MKYLSTVYLGWVFFVLWSGLSYAEMPEWVERLHEMEDSDDEFFMQPEDMDEAEAYLMSERAILWQKPSKEEAAGAEETPTYASKFLDAEELVLEDEDLG